MILQIHNVDETCITQQSPDKLKCIGDRYVNYKSDDLLQNLKVITK
jgi:hypothetical protein